MAIATQIAGALDKAHRAGVVHRDLKPGNVMLTKSGAGSTGSPQAKLLDFGLAKMSPVAQGFSPASVAGSKDPAYKYTALPTTPANITAQGTILGTFQYMAPEQIEGLEADARTDIFAFGALLYEMLTGKKAFTGSSHASLISSIFRDEPAPISTIQALAPRRRRAWLPWSIAAVMLRRLPAMAALCGVAASSAIAPIDVTVASRSMRPGELVVLSLTTDTPAERVSVRAFGRETSAFALDALAWRALIGIDLDAVAGTQTAVIEAEAGARRTQTRYTFTVLPRRFPTRTLHVDDAFVHPPPEMRARMDAERAQLERLWTESTARRLWVEPFVRPVSGPAVSAFGVRSIFNGVPLSRHSGADFMSAAGTPIAAPNAGRIVLARDFYLSGNTVVIDHGVGLLSLLAHLSIIDVHEGDAVTLGQIVGRVGGTGRVTGPHLHWAVRIGGARVDPLSVLALLGRGDVNRPWK